MRCQTPGNSTTSYFISPESKICNLENQRCDTILQSFIFDPDYCHSCLGDVDVFNLLIIFIQLRKRDLNIFRCTNVYQMGKSRELRTRLLQLNSIDILTAFPHYFCKRCMETKKKNLYFDSGF